MGYGLISLCYLWLGSTNTVLSYSNASLSRSKQRALAALVHLTLEPQQHGELFMDDCDNADDCDEEERDCLTALVRLVDYAFTSVASPVAIAALQSVDDGVNASEARQLLGEIDRQLGGLQLRKECAPEKNVERRNWRGYSAQTQKACLERIAVALVRATRQGKSANFKLEESAADQILRLLSSPLRRMAEFANPFLSLDPVSDLFSDTDFSNLGFLLLVLLAGAGLLVIAEAYVLSPLLGNKEEAAAGSGNGGNGGIGNAIGNAIEGFDARSFENDVPCYCRLCEGGIVRGRRIGEGGFGKCFLCNVLEKKKKSAAITTSPRATAAAAIGTTSAAKGAAGAGGSTTAVVKMIRTNFFYDVNVLQDALDEAKNLLSLRHQHIVKYLDVFVHRDNRAMRASRRKKSRSLSFGASGAFSDDDFGSDSDGDAAKKAALEEDKQEEEDERKGFDFVCIVMEYCAGGTLLEYVATGVPLPIDVLLCSFFQIATALRYVHRSGIVHHDVKLENIFIARCPTSMPSLSSSNISSAATFRPSSPVSPPKSANHRNRRRSRKGGGPGVSAALSSAAVTPPLPPSPASAVQQRDHHHQQQQESPSPQQPKESFVIKLGDFGLAVRQPSSVAPAATLVMSTALPASPIHSPPRNRQRQRQNTAQEAAVALNFDKPRDENRYKSEEPTVVQGPIDASSLEGKPRSDADGDDEGIAGAREHSDRAWSAPRAMATDDSTATTDRGAPTRELNMPGTKPYQAPECFDSERRPEDLTAAVDVWGFGCSLYEAVTCQSLPLESPFLGEIANQGFLRQQRRQRRRERRLFPPASPSAAAVDVNSGGSSRSGRDNYDDYDEDRGVDDYDEGHDDEDFDEDDWASAWADLSLNFAEGVQSLALCALADKNIDIGSLHGTGGGSAHQPSPATSPAPGSSAAFTSAAENSKQRKKGKRGGRRRRRGENDYDAAADDDRAMAWYASSSSPSSSEQKQADGSRAAVRSAVEAARNGLCELLRRCLSPDPHDRPSFDHIVNLPWLIPFRRSTLRFGFSFGRPAGSSNDQHRHRNNLRLRAKSMALFPGIPMRDSKNNSLVSAITQQRSLGRAVVRGAPVPQQRRRNSQDSSGSSGDDDDDDDDDDDGNPPTQEWLLPPASRRAAQRRQQRNTKAKSTGP